jgi:hypothetical protein
MTKTNAKLPFLVSLLVPATLLLGACDPSAIVPGVGNRHNATDKVAPADPPPPPPPPWSDDLH